MNSINTDEAIFMEMILAPDVAPEMARNQRMRGPNLLERLNCLNKGNIINTMKHFMMMVLYNYVARKQYFAGRRRVEALSHVELLPSILESVPQVMSSSDVTL